MKIGNLVTFNKVPGVNTPGVPSSDQHGVGTVVKDNHDSGLMFVGEFWCDVLWPSGEVTKCFKKDLAILDKSVNNFDSNLF